MTTTDDTKATTKHFATSFCHKSSEKMHVVDRRSIVASFYLKEKGEIFWKMFDQFLFFSCLVYRQNLPSGSVTKMQN